MGNAFVSAGILLALIANTHVYSEGFALIYGAVMLSSALRAWTRSPKADRIKCVVGLAIGIIGALVAVLQVAPSLTHSSVFTKNDLQFSLSNLKNLGGFFIGAGITDRRAMVLVAALYILTSIYLFKKDFQSLLILLVSNIYMALVCVFIYGAGVPNRAVMWFYFIIFSLWITHERLYGQVGVQQQVALHHDEGILIGKSRTHAIPSVVLALFSLFLLQPGKNVLDFKGLYSGESRFAYFIGKNIPDTERFFCNPNSWTCAIMEYLPGYKFYNVKDSKPLIPRADREGLDDEHSVQYLYDIFDNNLDKDFIYIIDSDIHNGKTNFIERNALPFHYEILYPQNEEQRDYFIQYFLIRVSRPTGGTE